MAYLSLYRKYRPQTFAQVMGQEHVVQTLQNALRLGHVANGYLFCGTRGVAKTTIARILAKCLNCLGPNEDFNTPQPEPCNVCASCVSIQSGQDVDVIEMDAASNRSVSDIARLRESVSFGPMQSRYKVYIIDEAHQLSSDAKDAFLKTLEEPPANVVFVLATTETQAIPITIASRCQHFDFHRGSVEQIAEQCKRVISQEDITMPDDAISIVSRAAEGSYRDALSLLDQVLAYKRDGITASDVAGVLGTVESEEIDDVLIAVFKKDGAALFSHADSIYLQGKDVRQFLRALSSRLRDALLIACGALPSGSGIEIERLKQIVKDVDKFSLVKMLEVVTEGERRIRQTDLHRILLETTLLRMTMLDEQPRTGVVQRPAPTRAVVAATTSTLPNESAAKNSKSSPVLEDENQYVPDLVSHAPPLAADPAATLRHLQTCWNQVLNHVKTKSPAGHPYMADSYPVTFNGTVFEVALSKPLFMDKFAKPTARQFVEDIINTKIFNTSAGTYRFKPVLAEQGTDIPRVGNTRPSKPVPAKEPDVRQQSFEDSHGTPVLDAVIAEFGGRIIEDPD